MLLKITMAATTTCFTGVGMHELVAYSQQHYKRPYEAHSALAPGASNRDNKVYLL